MAFSSTRRGGGWAHSLLPTSSPSPSSPSPNPKSKHPRKSRKRTAFRDFFLSNFFTIGLCLSLLFFLLVVFRYGVPKPLTSHFRHHSNLRPPKPRKPIYRKSPSVAERDVVSGAVVDITTKDLYDKIKFEDSPGGPWTQGWRVSYKGDEWDSEKLKVFCRLP